MTAQKKLFTTNGSLLLINNFYFVQNSKMRRFT